jgi:hypothetical protein
MTMPGTTLIHGRDASNPAGSLGKVDVAWGYIGGMTPHKWTDAQWEAQEARYRLPIYVYSQIIHAVDAAVETIAWLTAHKVPHGTLVMLDMETQIDVSWVDSYSAHVASAGWRICVYGSAGFVFGNPVRSGYVVADYNGVAHLYQHAHVIGTQYEADVTIPGIGVVDVSVMLADLPLWDTQPSKPPGPPAWHGLVMAHLDTINRCTDDVAAILRAHGI